MPRAGILGALVAPACFTLPSALLMIGLAYGVARVPDLSGAGWLHGLKLASVAVVAQAVGDDAFLAGYGAAQALPGPMFAFSAYLGAAMEPGPRAQALLERKHLADEQPCGQEDRERAPEPVEPGRGSRARAMLAGANAAVVGVLLAALYDAVFTGSVAGSRDAVAALLAFGCLEHWKLPP